MANLSLPQPPTAPAPAPSGWVRFWRGTAFVVSVLLSLLGTATTFLSLILLVAALFSQEGVTTWAVGLGAGIVLLGLAWPFARLGRRRLEDVGDAAAGVSDLLSLVALPFRVVGLFLR